MHFASANENGVASWQSVLPSVIGFIRESEICLAACYSVWSAGYLYNVLYPGDYFEAHMT